MSPVINWWVAIPRRRVTHHIPDALHQGRTLCQRSTRTGKFVDRTECLNLESVPCKECTAAAVRADNGLPPER